MKALFATRAVTGIAVLLVLSAFGCAGTTKSAFVHDESFQVNVPEKDAGCYDAAVLLGVDFERAREIARKVIVGLDATIKGETDDHIEAQRNRHMGLFVGSGGEKFVVELKRVDDNTTFITATTKTGFVGAMGMKPWSCQMVDAMVEMASN
jgi:hypothetical protein